MQLNTNTNIKDSDDFYARLLSAHHGLSAAQSHAFNARLVLVLANHIGDAEVLEMALLVARDTSVDQT